MDDGDYTIDLEELESVIAALEKCERELESLTDDLDRQMAALQSTWEGLSAQAQAEAQQEWGQGMLEMRAALVHMRRAARTASGNYHLMIKANTAIWSNLL